MILYTNLNNIREKKKIIIPESKLALLSEALSDEVFHYTSLNTGLKIANTDTIYLQSALGGSADNTNRKELYYLSLTRQRNVNFGYSYKFRTAGVRIEFDGRKLSQRFKGKAIDYWGSSMGKMSYYNGNRSNDLDSKAHHTSNESEDRMFSNEPALYDAHKYIKRIDVIFNPQDKEQYQLVYHMLMSKLNKWIFVYDNENDFNKQSDNTLNKQINDDYENFDKYYGTKPNDKEDRKSYTNVISKILKFIFAGEVSQKDTGREAANLLKQYGLEKYLNGQLINNINSGYYGGMKGIIDEVSNEISGLSRRPNEESQRVVKLLTDYFKKHGLRSYRDALKYKIELGTVSDYDSDQLTDKEKQIQFLTYKGRNFNEIIIPNPNKTSFWDIIPDRERFINNLYGMAEGKHKSKDDNHFYYYLQHLAKNNISVSQMLDIVNKLGIGDEEKRELFDFGSFQYENLKFFQAVGYRLPQFVNSQDFYHGKDSINNKNQIRKYYLK